MFCHTLKRILSFCNSGITTHSRQCFIGISKHREERWKYDAPRIEYIWIGDETLSRVVYISSQSKQKLRSKRGVNLIVKKHTIQCNLHVLGGLLPLFINHQMTFTSGPI